SPEEHRLHHGNEETFHDSIPTEVEDYQPKSVTLPEIKLPDPVDDRFQELPPPTVAQEQTQTIREIIKEVESASPETAQSPVTPLEKISLPDPWDMLRDREKEEVEASPLPQLPPAGPGDEDFPEIEVLDGNLDEIDSDKEAEQPPEKEPERTIHGILELKPPEADDAPFLTLTYDFSKIPHSYKLSKNYSIMEYSYYKYKPMLMKAQEFARRKMLKNALNYYRVIKSQNIPPELKRMVNRNITDITEFLEKYLMAKGG
ncbi:MAG: hypothetical protein K8R21_04290, partial [Leptospira sp.]|nr:hypothetical protein [Leptospira sp.]